MEAGACYSCKARSRLRIVSVNSPCNYVIIISESCQDEALDNLLRSTKRSPLMIQDSPVRLVPSVDSVSTQLRDRIGTVYIIAYREPTERLEAVLEQEGFQFEVLRQRDRTEYESYAATHRCLLNHHRAWEKASRDHQPTLIVEADFVPVVGLGSLPLPFNSQQTNVGMAWLYTCAPQLYSVTQEGFGEGFSSSLVAYVVTPEGAECLCELLKQVTAKYGTGYHTFDSKIDNFLRDRGFKNYVPFRNYGEHGGIPNPEHRRNGLSGIHHADLLYGKLAFMPAIVAGKKYSSLRLVLMRLKARLKGMARMLMGKYLRLPVVKTSSVPLRLIRFALVRHLAVRW